MRSRKSSNELSNNLKLAKNAAERTALLSKERFVKIDDYRTLSPEVLSPLPKAFHIRTRSDWWIRCASGDLINLDACYSSFLNINALGQKNHACHNCSLGKEYREMSSEGTFTHTRFDTLLQ